MEQDPFTPRRPVNLLSEAAWDTHEGTISSVDCGSAPKRGGFQSPCPRRAFKEPRPTQVLWKQTFGGGSKAILLALLLTPKISQSALEESGMHWQNGNVSTTELLLHQLVCQLCKAGSANALGKELSQVIV